MKLGAIALLAAAAASFGSATSALAQQVKPEDQIRYRQSAMNVQGRNFGLLNAMAKGDVPYDPAAAAKAATIVDLMSSLHLPLYAAGTEKGAPTKADEKIWKEGDKFKAAMEKMQGEAKKLPAAAGDPARLKAQVGETGKACKACHDDYRLKEFRS